MNYITTTLDLFDVFDDTSPDHPAPLVIPGPPALYLLTPAVLAWVCHRVSLARQHAEKGKIDPNDLQDLETRLRAIQDAAKGMSAEEIAKEKENPTPRLPKYFHPYGAPPVGAGGREEPRPRQTIPSPIPDPLTDALALQAYLDPLDFDHPTCVLQSSGMADVSGVLRESVILRLGDFPPIAVSPATWERCQAALQELRVSRERAARQKHQETPQKGKRVTGKKTPELAPTADADDTSAELSSLLDWKEDPTSDQ